MCRVPAAFTGLSRAQSLAKCAEALAAVGGDCGEALEWLYESLPAPAAAAQKAGGGTPAKPAAAAAAGGTPLRPGGSLVPEGGHDVLELVRSFTPPSAVTLSMVLGWLSS